MPIILNDDNMAHQFRFPANFPRRRWWLTLTQVRGAKRNTYDPSNVVRKRRHGFLARLRSRTGRKILKRRMLKGRSTLSY